MKLFLFILDGCSALQLKTAETPCIDELCCAGQYSMKCRAVFPTATYTGHATIITGNYPSKHGMVGNQFWDRYHKCIRDFDYFNPNKNIQSATIFELLPFSTCAVCEPVTKGATRTVEKKVFDKIPIKMQNRAIFETLMDILSPDCDFYMVNFQGVDGIGETIGPETGEYLNCLEEVDEFILKIRNKIQSDFIFIITADHGMTSVNENIDLEGELLKAGFQVKCLASHRTSHIYTKSAVENVERYLNAASYIDKVFNKKKIEDIHLDHPRTGDLVASASRGYEFGDRKLEGSHGGATDEEMYVPFIFYDSTNKFTEKVSLESVSLVDICPTILDLFGIKGKSQFQGKTLYRES